MLLFKCPIPGPKVSLLYVQLCQHILVHASLGREFVDSFMEIIVQTQSTPLECFMNQILNDSVKKRVGTRQTV